MTVMLALAAGALPAQAEQAVGVVNGGNLLVTFDTANPGTYTSFKEITGLSVGEQVLGLDFRHLPAQVAPIPQSRLFALGVIPNIGDSVRLLTIDPGTGQATAVGSTFPVPQHANGYGMDFNPAVDRIRIVNDADANLRVNPNNGAVAGTDAALNPAGNKISGVAYDRVNIPQPPSGQTTLYGISVANNSLVRIGGVNGTPSPNGGAVTSVGPLGVLMPSNTTAANLDIAFGGTAFATLTSSATGIPGLYTIDLGTGAATLAGALPSELRGFATVPGSTAQFEAAAVSQPESGAATVTVTRAGSAAGTTTVAYATSDGTATAGDYGAVSGTLTFGPDETSKTFSVPVVADAVDEPDETVNLTLSQPSPPMALGAQSTAVLTIADDDAPPAAPPAPPSPDTTAPVVKLSGVPGSMKLKAFLKGIKAKVTPGEPASLSAVLEGTVKTARISAYNLQLASRSLALAAGPRTLALKPNSRLVGRPRKKFKVRLRLTATDAARNAKVVIKTITVKP